MESRRPLENPLLLAAACATLLATGCASYSTHLSPRPTAKGHTDLAVVVDVASVTDSDKRIIMPQVEIGIRHGLSDRADIGGKINAQKAGGEINARILLADSDALTVGIVPGAGVGMGAFSDTDISGLVTYFALPLLMSLHFGEDFELILGPKAIAQFSVLTSKPVGEENAPGGSIVMLPGGLVAMSIKLADTFALIPEVTVLFPKDVDRDDWNKPFIQGGLSFHFQVD
ncbi:hypothetical protein L6R52_09000 [Myxococcota bacterium]|nr:hypothetical protein [Myxococcota bacterium]